MVYTEIKQRNNNQYYYRVLSIRDGNKVSKKREYLGKNLSNKELSIKEKESYDKLSVIKNLRGLDKLKPKIIAVLRKNNIKRAGIFGSYSTGKEKKNSDIDILIQPSKNMGFKFAGLEIELSKKLGRKVDLVSYNGLSPYLKNKILSQEIRII